MKLAAVIIVLIGLAACAAHRRMQVQPPLPQPCTGEMTDYDRDRCAVREVRTSTLFRDGWSND